MLEKEYSENRSFGNIIGKREKSPKCDKELQSQLFLWNVLLYLLGLSSKLCQNSKNISSELQSWSGYLHIYKRGMILVPVKFGGMSLTAGVLGWKGR